MQRSYRVSKRKVGIIHVRDMRVMVLVCSWLILAGKRWRMRFILGVLHGVNHVMVGGLKAPETFAGFHEQ